MWMHLYLKMDSLIKCFLFSNVFLFLGHWWRTGGDWDECWSKRRMTFPQTDATVVLKEDAALDVVKDVKVTWHTTKNGDPYSEFVLCNYPILSAHTQQWTHTHTVNTYPEQWAAIYAAVPGEQLRVRCLVQGHLSRGIEGGESAVHSLPPPTIPAGNLWVMSPTL